MIVKVVVEPGELEELGMSAEDLEWEVAELFQNKHETIAMTVEVEEEE